MNTSGEGRFKVWLKKEEIGDDLVYILGGGERPHIGSIVVKQPGEGSKLIKLEGHYDHVVLEPIAVKACGKYGKTVVAVGGVHVDNASKEEIDLLISNCREFLECI